MASHRLFRWSTSRRVWQYKRYPNNDKFFSISTKLQAENKVNEPFEIMLNNLTLEEIIALKLELASKSIGGLTYGLPIYYNIVHIVKDAILKYAFSCSTTIKDVRSFLGINYYKFSYFNWTYGIKKYFGVKEKKYFPLSKMGYKRREFFKKFPGIL